MKCTIPGENVKIVARALHALVRIGDELYIESLADGMVFRTVNSSQSAFAEFKFFHHFFSAYNMEDLSDESPQCKISMKSCMSVFKNPHSMDKMVDSCQLRIDPSASQIVMQIKYAGGINKTHLLPILDCENLQIKYKKNESTRLVTTSKLLSTAVKNFRLNEDEITVSVDARKTTLRNHIDSDTESSKVVRTGLSLLAGEFEVYCVERPVCITFCLKVLRAVVSFAEPAGLSISMYFDDPGRPAIFTLVKDSTYEANFVVSTLAFTDTNGESSQNSEASTFNNSHTSKENHQLINVNGSNVETNVAQCSSSNRNGCEGSESIFSNMSVSKKRPHESDDDDNDFLNLRSKQNGCGSPIMSCSTSSRDTLILPCDNIDGDLQNSCDMLERPNFDIRNVFRRCFNETFQKNKLPGYSNVIAYDSDGMEDSD